MRYFLGIDDTDTFESRGTGQLARTLADELGRYFSVHGVTRHQLLEDDRVPKTAKNSCAAIIFSGDYYSLADLAQVVRKVMLDDYQQGSDPGLCVASHVPEAAVAFGKLVKVNFVEQAMARDLAGEHQLHLEGLGGNEDGVIGALAAVGLASSGEDGRYVAVGSIRSLSGVCPVSQIIKSGVKEILSISGEKITDGFVLADKLRPARRDGRPVLYVEPGQNYWRPLKLD